MNVRAAVARRAAGAFAAALLLTACSYVPPPAFPRSALPLPAATAARYELTGAPTLTHLDQRAGDDVLNGELQCGPERVRFHLLRAGAPGRPLVLLVPILAGGDDLMRGLARRIAGHGFHAAWCDRAGPALSPPQRGPELEQLFVRTVLHQRALLAWLRRDAETAPPCAFALGVSMGGMVTGVLAAVEPNLDGVAICLAGANLPDIVLDSDETRVVRWRQWRMTADGIGEASLRQELQRHLQSDPGRMAPYVATEHVLLVHATLDEVIRRPHQDLLWEALGRPRRLLVPLGHYSAALAIDAIVDAVAAFFHERQAAIELAKPMAKPMAKPPELPRLGPAAHDGEKVAAPAGG